MVQQFPEFFSLADQGIVSAAGLVTGALVGRYGGGEELGLYMLGLTIALLVSEFQVSLISTPYMIYSPRLRSSALRDYTGSTLLQQMTLGLVMTLVVSGAGMALVTSQGRVGLGSTLLALGPALFAIVSRDHVRRIEYARLRPKRALAVDALVSGIQVPLLIYLSLTERMTAALAFGAVGIATGIGWAGWMVASRPSLFTVTARLIPDLHRGWRLGRWLLASSAVWAMATHSYPWMLDYFRGTAEVGVWAACFGTLAFARVPLVGFQNMIGPKLATLMAKRGAEALRKRTDRYALRLGLSLGVAALLFWAFGERLIVLVYGSEFSGLGDLVFVLALAVAAMGTAFPYSRALFVLDRANLDFTANLIPIAVLVTLGLAFTQRFGALGAASSLLLANVLAASVRYALFTHVASRKTGSQS